MPLRTIIFPLVLIASAVATAQPPGFGPPPGFHLMEAIDTNGDHKLSSAEIDNAVRALQTLDKDKDGKLSRQEIGWPPVGGFDRGGRGGGPGGPGGFPGFGGPRKEPSRRPGFDSGGTRPSEPRSATPPRRRSGYFSAKMLGSLDRDKDGTITTKELPQLIKDSILGKVDINKDGVIDTNELEKLDEENARQK